MKIGFQVSNQISILNSVSKLLPLFFIFIRLGKENKHKFKIMLTDQEMLKIAERFIKRIVSKHIEPMLYNDIIKKPYGNIYSFNSKEYILTGDFDKSLMGGGPFLVEKKQEEWLLLVLREY